MRITNVALAAMVVLTATLVVACSNDKEGRNESGGIESPIVSMGCSASSQLYNDPEARTLAPEATPAPFGERGSNTYTRYLVSLESGSSVVVSEDAEPTGIVWSPDSCAFSHRATPDSVWTVVTVADPTTPVVAFDARYVGPQAWAYDATVALLTDVPTEHRGVPTGKENVLVARRANGDITELDRIQTGAQTYQSSFIPVDWLPDGRLLTLLMVPANGAATSPNDDPASSRLVAYPLSGKPEVIHDFDCPPNLQYSPVGLENPSLSPDRQRFAWAGGCYDETEGGGLWVLDIATGEAQQLVDSSWIGDYEWSPDGRDIVYSQLSEEGTREYVNSGIFVVRADGGTPTQLTAPNEHTATTPSGDGSNYYDEKIIDYGAHWLPEGSSFAFWRNFNPNCSDCGGGQTFRVTTEGIEEALVEGVSIEAIHSRGIVIDDGSLFFQPTGSDERILIDEPEDGGDRFMRAQISPDGKWLTYLAYNCDECEYP